MDNWAGKKLGRLEDSLLYWEREVYAPRLRARERNKELRKQKQDDVVNELLKGLNFDIPQGWKSKPSY